MLHFFDKDLFLQSRRNLGDREGTPIFQLLIIFRETQIFEQFVRNRIDDWMKKKPVLLDAPLYSLALNYHRNQRIPFTLSEIRQVVRQMSQYNSSRFVIMWTNNVRKRAMELTSNNRDEARVEEAMKKLVQECRESTILLVDVMGVVWERLRTCRGMQWKHGLYGLQLLRKLILEGPVTAVSDALECFGKINKLLKYENIRSAPAQQIRQAAREVSVLLMNRSKLFQQRRFLALQRKDKVVLKREDRIKITMKFAEVHAKVKPSGFVTQRIETTDFLSVTMPPKASVDQWSQSVDLISLQSDPSQATPVAPSQLDAANNLSNALGNFSISNPSPIPPSYSTNLTGFGYGPTAVNMQSVPPPPASGIYPPQQQAYYGFASVPQQYSQQQVTQSAPVGPTSVQLQSVPSQPASYAYPPQQQAYYSNASVPQVNPQTQLTQSVPMISQQQYNTVSNTQQTPAGQNKVSPKNFDPFA